jgi:hypothetical protein
MNVDIVYFNTSGDGVTAMYIDGKLHTYGDYYHNKIDFWVMGFLDGLIYSKKQFIKTIHEIEYEDNDELVEQIVELGMIPPKLLTAVLGEGEHHDI